MSTQTIHSRHASAPDIPPDTVPPSDLPGDSCPALTAPRPTGNLPGTHSPAWTPHNLAKTISKGIATISVHKPHHKAQNTCARNRPDTLSPPGRDGAQTLPSLQAYHPQSCHTCPSHSDHGPWSLGTATPQCPDSSCSMSGGHVESWSYFILVHSS